MSAGTALTLAAVCARLGISVRTGVRWLRAGTFPIPALPHARRGHWKFSSIHVDRYFTEASLASARTRGRRATAA